MTTTEKTWAQLEADLEETFRKWGRVATFALEWPFGETLAALRTDRRRVGRIRTMPTADVEQARATFQRETGKTPEEAIADAKRTLDSLVSVVAPIIQNIITAWTAAWEQTLYPFFHNAYLDAGAPYGDDMPGMFRWLREVSGDQPSE